MVRESQMSVCALNISMHKPHSPERYVELFKSAFRSRCIVFSHGHGALLGSLYGIDKDDTLQGLRGEIYRFIHLDQTEPWFNLNNKQAANEDELKEIKIPEYLKPHFARFSFVFFPKGHKLYVEMRRDKKNITPSSVATIFKEIFLDEALSDFRDIEVVVIPDSNEIDEILKIPSIHTLTIELFRPNSDDNHDDEVRLLKILEEQNAKKMRVTYTATNENSFAPDSETKKLAHVAAKNGYVSASGFDINDRKVERSTKNTPWLERFPYDANDKTSDDVLLIVAKQMHSRS